jgi:hypothetical protein
LSDLDAPFSEEGVWAVIKSQEPDKAPGPDGFTGRFYTVCWHIIKHDDMEAFETLWRGDARGLQLANQALISLLPKHTDVVEVRDFRPISLLHRVAKFVAKVLSSRLAPKLPQIVGPHQSAFIRGVVFMITSSWCNARLGVCMPPRPRP